MLTDWGCQGGLGKGTGRRGGGQDRRGGPLSSAYHRFPANNDQMEGKNCVWRNSFTLSLSLISFVFCGF